MFSITTAPAKQSVSETITVLSSRLGSATLLEDRRAAILGLRSFAKDFPASVASGALRSLIESLNKDGEDVDTVKVVLETLLMLFSPNEDSPEASGEIALWLADEFTQRQENITVLLDFLETSDFYSRLYSLQLLSAISSARTERTEECIFTAPLGIPRLVAVMDDQREAVRNEAIALLTSLSPTSIDIQKLIAFENAFDRLFGVIAADGSLSNGGRTVEDCLILLANLLRGNASNQSLFRESGCIRRLAELLHDVIQPSDEWPDIASWAQSQKNRNIYAFLAVIRLFIVPGSVVTPRNQTAIWKNDLAYYVLQLAFSGAAQTQIRAEALSTCADIIRKNASLQETFAQIMVPSPMEVPETPVKPTNAQTSPPKVYVIDGLLDLTLCLQDPEGFDVRYAACECLQAYFSDHAEVRSHFLARAIEGHQSGRDESANILTVLLQAPADSTASDPYRYWFASVILFHLIYDNPATKADAMSLTEGDSADGEEVVTSIQTIAAHVISGIRRGDDPRILVGYLMLLLGWLFEDLDAVNDFLVEGSNVQSLIQAVVQPSSTTDGLVQGLCAMLLGVAYEFSTKDSPIPRITLHNILSSRLDRDVYLDKLGKLRSHPLLRDFEVTPQKLGAPVSGRLADVFFDKTFVEFFKDNYSRLARSIDRDPGTEISVITNGVQKGISRDLVDSLRDEVEEKNQSLQQCQEALSSLEKQLGQEQADHRRTRETSAVDMSRMKTVNDSLQKTNAEELRKLQSLQAVKDNDHRKQLAQLQAQQSMKDNDLQKQLLQSQKAAEAENERLRRRAEADMAGLRAGISRLEVDLSKAQKSKTQELQKMQDENTAKLTEQAARTAEAEKSAKEAVKKSKEVESRASDLEKKLNEAQTTEAHLRKLVDENSSKLTEQVATLTQLRATIQALEAQAKDAESQLQRAKEAVKEAEQKSQAADKKRQETEDKANTAENKLKASETKTKDAEKKVNEAEKRTQEAEKKSKAAEKRAREADKNAKEADQQGKNTGNLTKSEESRSKQLEKQLGDVQAKTKEMETKIKKMETDLAASNSAKEASQSELEDLLMVFGDLEEKVNKYKDRLTELGEPVSEGEEEDDEDNAAEDSD